MGEIQHQKVEKNPKTNQTKIQKKKQKAKQTSFKSKEKVLIKKR